MYLMYFIGYLLALVILVRDEGTSGKPTKWYVFLCLTCFSWGTVLAKLIGELEDIKEELKKINSNK